MRPSIATLCTLVTTVLPSLAGASDAQVENGKAAQEKALVHELADPVLSDRAADGALWVLGANWKMRFASDRTTYHPRFGSRAPRTPTLDVSLAAVTIGGRPLELAHPEASPIGSDLVEYDRGVLLERWKLEPHQVEQTFVFERSPGDGDLVLEFGPGTDLVPDGVDGEGLRFAMQGVGDIRFGQATLIDARGNRSAVSTAFDAGRLSLRVPAATLAHSQYPIVIDPLITNVTVSADLTDEFHADSAFGLVSYLVVYERVFSATDHDIISRRFDEDGNFLETLSVDFSNENTVDPAVAGHLSSFMIVWNQLSDGSLFSDNVIRGRRRIETTGVQAAAFDISTGANNETKPDVGASPNLISRPFFVVWSEDPVIGIVETHGRAVDELGSSLGSDVSFGAGNLVDGPRISKSAGAAGRYVVCWETLGTTDRFLDAQMVSEGGSKLGSLQIIETNLLADEFHADVDGDGTNWMVVRENRTPLGDLDVVGTFLFAPTASTLVSGGELSLSKLIVGSGETANQTNPAIGSEGCRFTVAYQEPEPFLGTTRISTTTLVTAAGSPLQTAIVDGPATHGTFAFTESDLGVVTTQFKKAGDVLLTWSIPEPSSNSKNIEGALRNTLQPGGVVSIAQTGCGSPEPLLLTSAIAEAGGSFQVLIGNASSPTALLAVGFPTAPISFCPGQAAGCQLGVNIVSLLTVPTTVGAQLPCSPTLVGFTIAFQAIDVLPANAVGTFCGPPKYSQKFKVSDTVSVKFQ